LPQTVSPAGRLFLSGPLLIANDPYNGVRYEGARLVLPEGPGLGVTRA